MGQEMEDLARQEEGYLALESTRNSEGLGITISYWKTLKAIQSWKLHAEHVIARDLGRAVWYNHFHVRIAKVEREYSFQRASSEEMAKEEGVPE
jgi:heme-degrading monooxygenase HmoA